MLLNLVKQEGPNINKIYLYLKHPFQPKYQLLINGRDKKRIEKTKETKTLVDYSQTIDDVCENLEGYIPTKKRKELLMFDDMIADTKANKILRYIVTELFLRGRKLKISLYHDIIILFQNA